MVGGEQFFIKLGCLVKFHRINYKRTEIYKFTQLRHYPEKFRLVWFTMIFAWLYVHIWG